MPLQAYPFAAKYGWTRDRYGVEWQLFLDKDNKRTQKVAPACLFVDDAFGKAEAAVKFYTSFLPNSAVVRLSKDEGMKAMLHCELTLCGRTVVIGDGPGKHNYKFSEAFSFVLSCDTPQETDEYAARLVEGGAPGQRGWLKDKFGMSWQVLTRVEDSAQNHR
jgi:predicted 3-demethylubiquinone-9 3-methyltransferase (glyoxalase superfamily)